MWFVPLIATYVSDTINSSSIDLYPGVFGFPAAFLRTSQSLSLASSTNVPEDAFWAEAGKLRGQVPDRALLRAAHFLEEDRRAAAMSDALAQNDIPQILALFSASGRSSQQLLQNAWPDAKPEERGISLALLLSSHLLQNKGACRIHGGGFAGSILALAPQELATAYQREMEAAFGPNSCRRLYVRPAGAGEILL